MAKNDKQSKKKFNKGKKFKSSTEKKYEEDSKKVGSNDISWYGNEDFIRAAARLNFTNPLGKKIGYDFYHDPNGATTGMLASADAVSTLPGVCSFGVLHTPGFCQYGSDAANVFVRNFYSWIRHQNSGHANYDAPDLGMYLMAIDEIHAWIEHAIRIYGIARTASSANRYIPDALLKAVGVDGGTSLYNNLADYRARLLGLMVKAGTFCVPKDIKYNERHRELYKYVYADGETAKAALYVFWPQYYRTYNEVNGKLVTVENPGSDSAFTILQHIEDMINALIGSESMNIMSGDILKAYGPENVYKMEYFGEDYTVLPTYNSEMLLEIHNLRPTGKLFTTSAGDIIQDTNMGILQATPYFTQSAPIGEVNPIIDMPIQDPDPNQIMIATRLANVGGVGYMTDAAKWKYTPFALGSECVTSMTIYGYSYDNTLQKYSMDTGINGGVGSIAANLAKAMRISSFDWHPSMYVCTANANSNSVSFNGVISPLENYTVVDAHTLQKIHEYALIGLFRVPLMGTWETNFTR